MFCTQSTLLANACAPPLFDRLKGLGIQVDGTDVMFSFDEASGHRRAHRTENR